MIDEKMLSELKPYIEECLKFGNYPQTHPEDMLELIRLARLGLSAQGVIKEAVLAIDWDQQDGSCYSIGEDGAELLLMKLGYDWNRGLSNAEVEAFAAPPKEAP